MDGAILPGRARLFKSLVVVSVEDVDHDRAVRDGLVGTYVRYGLSGPRVPD
jgi:hypothetical protein